MINPGFNGRTESFVPFQCDKAEIIRVFGAIATDDGKTLIGGAIIDKKNTCFNEALGFKLFSLCS